MTEDLADDFSVVGRQQSIARDNPRPSRLAAYAAFMQKWGVTKEKVAATELITNDLIDEINRFNSADIVAMAKAWKPK